MSRNKLVLTFMGGDDVGEDERLLFERLILTAWPTIDVNVIGTMRGVLEAWPEEIVEVYYRPGTENLVVHVYDAKVWREQESPAAIFHTKIDSSGAFS